MYLDVYIIGLSKQSGSPTEGREERSYEENISME